MAARYLFEEGERGGSREGIRGERGVGGRGGVRGWRRDICSRRGREGGGERLIESY